VARSSILKSACTNIE
jgi:hypothetical protein